MSAGSNLPRPKTHGTVTDGHSVVFDGSTGQYIKDGGSAPAAGTVTTTGSPASGNLTKFSGSTSITNGDLSGDVTTSSTLATTIANNAVTTAKINNSAVTLAKIANAAANSVLVGSGSAGSGSAYSEIALGSGLSMSGTTLSATGSGGNVTHTGTLTANQLIIGNGSADVTALGSLGTTTTVLHGNASGAPTFGQVAISTDVSGLGTGVATFLATPSSANLAGALTDETGTGKAVFDTAPTFPSTIDVGKLSSATGAINIKGTTSGTCTLSVADAAGTNTFKLPTTDGSSGDVMRTDGAGQLSFGSPAIGSAGYAFFSAYGTGAGFNPADATPYYWGQNANTSPSTTTDGGFRFIMPITGTIKKCYGQIQVTGTLGSAGVNSTVTMRNITANSTEDVSTTVAMSATLNNFSNTAMTLAITAGDAIVMKLTTGTWGTNPTGTFGYFTFVVG